MTANVETMVYVREKPWHGLGVRVEEAMTSSEALRLSGLDWTVTGLPVFSQDGPVIPGYKANTRDKDGSVLGIVGSKYSILQNKDAFEFTDALVGEGMTYETAGSLRGGKQVWLLGKMPDRYVVGDKVEPYICFTNAHDGTLAVRACMTPVRVVCNNTLNLALRTATRAWSTPHKGNVQAKLQEARETLLAADAYITALDEEADRMANQKMSEGQITEVVSLLFPVPEKATDRQKQTVERAKEEIYVCMMAPDLVQFAGTRWGFLNAVSDYVGHGTPGRRTHNFAENRWRDIMGGHKLLDKAMAYSGSVCE